jgi:SAM-dependent methyltransferase
MALGLERVATTPDIRVADIATFREGAGEWAAVVFWHALEHLRDPAGAIAAAHALLTPGGLLIVAVPNRASWQARVLGRRWLALDLPRHLVHIAAPALLDGLHRAGFEVQRVSFWRGGQVAFGWLHGLVATLTGLDLYDALRRPEARHRTLTASERATALAAGVALAPLAALVAAGEVAARAGGSVYVEARRL